MSKKERSFKRDISRARSWTREGRWDEEAVALNTKILEKAPNRVGAYVRRGRCYLEMGLTAEAERDFRIALEKQPDNEEARSLLNEAQSTVESAPMEDPAPAFQDSSCARDEASDVGHPEPPTTRPEFPTSPYTGWGNHSVYVVVLDRSVWERSRFREENPGYVQGMPFLYVGLTGLDPEERFDNHMAGHKASRYVRDFGLGLLPELYEHLNPLPFEEAQRLEAELASFFRESGCAVWSH